VHLVRFNVSEYSNY